MIAIDGPSGVGKSTVGRAVAQRMGLPFLSTGVFYRALTLAALRAHVGPEDSAALDDLMDDNPITTEDDAVFLDGEDVTTDIRTETVTDAVSAYSASPQVRTRMVDMQRAWLDRRDGRGILEGRDIGTVVLPDAPLKVWLDARPEVRAARRSTDTEAGGRKWKDIAEDMARRDHFDSSRELSPMHPAEDAVTIDTSDMTEEEVIDAVVALARERAGS